MSAARRPPAPALGGLTGPESVSPPSPPPSPCDFLPVATIIDLIQPFRRTLDGEATMRPSQSRVSHLRSRWGWRVERWGLALLLAGTAVVSGCWLDRIVDVPTVQDGGSAATDGARPSSDAGAPPTTGSGGCQWVAPSKSGCALTNVSCNQLAACPPSWMQANSVGSCPVAGAPITTETCDGMYRWSLSGVRIHPGDGTLVGVCYYDMSGGLLVGIDWQGHLALRNKIEPVRELPAVVPLRRGVAVQRFICSSAGSGDQTDGGYTSSCSEQMPCHGAG